MSSIDWQRLTEEHDRAPELDDQAWLEALAILDEDPEERRRAEEADPLLMFRRLPEPQVTGADIDAMKAAVANMRQVSDTLAENSPPSGRRQRVATLAARWAWPLAALLAVAISSSVLVGGFFDTPADSPAMLAASLSSAQEPTFAAAPFGAGTVRAEWRSADLELGSVRIDGAQAAASLAAAELPLVEDADPGSDLLMQIENDEMSLVVVLTDQDV